MVDLISPCGLICSECPSYRAGQAEDPAEQQRLLEGFREQYHAPDMELCDGCPGNGKRLIAYCASCAVRACAQGRGVETCAHCPDFGCGTLIELIGAIPQAQNTLRAIRTALSEKSHSQGAVIPLG